MPIVHMRVQDKLGAGFTPPELEVLKPDNQNYRCLLLQPSGPIYADNTRIGHLNSIVAGVHCKKFLEIASAEKIELVVTPEYCVPWELLREIATGPIFPSPGRLWVLGCESATTLELTAFKGATAQNCNTLHEELPSQGTYTDPLAYCFQTQDNHGVWHRVILLQFKTTASRDGHFLENEHLQLGSVIYQFQNHGSLLKLATIICSDSFAVADAPELLKQLTDRSTLIHIQLNPNPRHPDYRAYRSQTFRRDPDVSNCDIICLNWAQKINQHHANGGEPAKWNNIAGSAWYLPLSRCSTQDQEILRNHEMGLYYCFMAEYRHALFFHYDEAIFQLTVTKPYADGFGVVANKQGPLMIARWQWDDALNTWQVRHEPANSGLKELIEADLDVNLAVSHVATTTNALAVERALALACGAAKHTDQWFKVDELDSCRIERDEVVRRITFPSDNCEQAKLFRHERLQCASILGRLLINSHDWPPQVADIQGAQIEWSTAEPNYNVHKAGVKPAVVVYLGEHPQDNKVRSVADGLLELLRREGRSYWRRLAICYRRNGELKFASLPALMRINFAAESLADITEVLDSNGGD